MSIIHFVVAALIVEALWETTKLFWQNGKLSIDRIGAVVFGEIIALGAGIDFMEAIGLSIKIPFIGMILTGLLISRGANFMHDIIGTVDNILANSKNK